MAGGGSDHDTGGHTLAVSSVQWYPVDTGAFISSGHDGKVKFWDTNTLQVVMDVTVSRHVYAAKMPSLARLGSGAAHCLIAIGCDDVAPEMYSGGGGWPEYRVR